VRCIATRPSDPDPRSIVVPEPIELESATNYFVTAAWVAGAVTIAYAAGLLHRGWCSG
jgi:hypothetical protein